MAQLSGIAFTILFLLTLANHGHGHGHGQALVANKRKCTFTSKAAVAVTNKVPSSSMYVHCQSKDDDLGYRTLAFGQDFSWDFCESYWGNTLFFCHVWWGSKQASFDAFASKWKRIYPNCAWELREDGLYLNEDVALPIYTKKVDWTSTN